MNRVLFLFILTSWPFIKGHGQENFYQSKGWSVHSGLHLAYPSVIFRNEHNFKNAIPSLQLWISKEFYHEKSAGIIISLGLTRDLFNVLRSFENLNGSIVYQQRRIHMLYGNTEVGGRFTFLSKLSLPLYTSLSFRVSTPLTENYSQIYVVDAGSTDMGINLKIGPKFTYGPLKLFVQLNYYQGLTKLGRNNILTSTGSWDSYIQNRSLGLQLGIFL